MTVLTTRDRQIASLRQEIGKVEVWLHVDRDNRRAVAFHQNKLAELRAELSKLEDRQNG